MESEFTSQPLGEVLELLLDHRGRTPKKLGGDFSSAGIPVVSAKNVKGGRLEFSEDRRYVTPEMFERWMPHKLMVRDILLTSEAPLGEAVYLKDDANFCLGQRLFGLRANPKKADARYLYYWLTSSIAQGRLHARATGTTAQGIRQAELVKVAVDLPSLEKQKQASQILGSLDDKIELNRRMNESLEAMSRALFKCWFVDFEPVRMKAEGKDPSAPVSQGGLGLDPAIAALFPDSFEDSVLGEIPTGWESGQLGDCIEIFDSKRVPLASRERATMQGDYPYYGAASVLDFVDDYLFDGIFVLTGEDGTVMDTDGSPATQYVWGKFWVNNHAHILKGKNQFTTEHLLLLLKSLNIAAYITGAVQAKLNQENLRRIPVVLASKELLAVFGSIIAPMYSQFRELSNETMKLISVRDGLLPIMLSGVIELKGSVK